MAHLGGQVPLLGHTVAEIDQRLEENRMTRSHSKAA